jgi:hypothetical protein
MAMGLARARLRAAAMPAVLCAIAAVTAAASVTGCAGPAARPSGPPVVAAAQQPGVPVVFDCGSAQVRPSDFVLTCADYGDFLDRLRWVSWAASAAFGSGIESIHDCTPSCVANPTFHTFPVLVVLWRPEPWPGHRGQSCFTRLTDIYTGQRPRYQTPRPELPAGRDVGPGGPDLTARGELMSGSVCPGGTTPGPGPALQKSRTLGVRAGVPPGAAVAKVEMINSQVARPGPLHEQNGSVPGTLHRISIPSPPRVRLDPVSWG